MHHSNASSLPPRPPRRHIPRARAAAAALLAALLLLGIAHALAHARLNHSATPSSTPTNPRSNIQNPKSSLALPEHYILATTWTTAIPTGNHLFHPEGIDVDSHGLVVIAETGNHRVSRLHANGEPIAHWGRRGSGPGEFDAPEDVAIDTNGDRIYVADTGNRRVQVLAQDGAPLATWSDVGLPRGIAVGSDGQTPDTRVYVADAAGQRILVFAPDGTRLAEWGQPGTAPGELDTPLGVAVARDGTLLVADSGNQRVQWFDPAGTPLGALPLDSSTGPGGVPRDVAIDANRDLYIAVDRGVLHFRGFGPGDHAKTLPPMREVQDPDCQVPCRCFRTEPEMDNHEGIHRLALRAGVGLFVTYAPALRWQDRVIAFPAGRGGGPVVTTADAARVWPRVCRDIPGPETRHATDLARLDAGDDPYFIHGLDSSGQIRAYQSNGQWYDPYRGFAGGPGLDIAADLVMPFCSGVLTGNQVTFTTLNDFTGEGPHRAPADVLEPRQMIRRDRTNECQRAEPPPWRPDQGPCVPDDRWWHTALTLRDEVVAVLNVGYQQAILRQDGNLLGGLQLNPASQPFRAFSDLAFDVYGNLWVLARDGAVQMVDPRGRPRGEVALVGLAPRTAEALAMAPDGTFFVLTGDGWVFKYALADDAAPPPTRTPTATPTRTTTPFPPPRLTPRPTPSPTPSLSSRAVIRAAWRIADLAGPGRYRDITVGPDERVFIPDGQHDRVLVFAPGPPDPSPEPIPPPSGPACRFSPAKAASPVRLALGDTTDVTLWVEGACPASVQRLDVVLVFDASCQMGGDRLGRARDAAVALIRAADLERDRIALVTFTEEQGGGRVVMPFSDDRNALVQAAQDLPIECHFMEACLSLPIHVRSYLFPAGCKPEGRISDGLRTGRETLFGASGRDGAGKVLVLLSPSLYDSPRALNILGRNPRMIEPPYTAEEQAQWERELNVWPVPPVSDREHALWEGWQLRDLGVRVLTSGVGLDSFGGGHAPDQGLLATLAYPAGNYRLATTPRDLPDIYGQLGRDLARRLLFSSLVITDRIPSNMRLVPGSIQPPAEILPDGSLRWSLADVGLNGPPELRYALEPLAAGTWPTNLEAVAAYTDGLGTAGRLVFPVPEVEVLAPAPSATPTLEPTPTDPPTATATETATATATVTPRPRPTIVHIHLPIAYRLQCHLSARPVDVALAIDTSSSMNGPKIEAARAAARTFIGLLNLPQDHAAVVSFDERARVAQALTGDRTALEAALASLPTAVGTRIDLGLWVALEELGGLRHRPGVDTVLVLLTDGRPQGGTEASMRLAVGLARDLGVTTYAIGLGDDVQRDVLLEIAGDRDRVHLAPSERELAAIYREVARVIPCR